MSEENLAQLFRKYKRDFLRGDSLMTWELETIKSFVGACVIRRTLPFLLLILLAVGFFGTLVVNASKPKVFFAELIGVTILQLLLLATSVKSGRRWPLMVMAFLYTLPFMQSILTLIVGVCFSLDGNQTFAGQDVILRISPFMGVPQLVIAGWLADAVKAAGRVQDKVRLTSTEFTEISKLFARIGDEREYEEWRTFGKLGNRTIKTRFFQNVILFVCGRDPLNYLTHNESKSCLIAVDRKKRRILKKWPCRFYGRKKISCKITLTTNGFSRLEAWMAKPFADQRVERKQPSENADSVTIKCPSCDKSLVIQITNESRICVTCPSCKTDIKLAVSQ